MAVGAVDGDSERELALRQAGKIAHFNAEIAFQWLFQALKSGYSPAPTSARLEEFLLSIGRRKFIKPLYEELVKSEGGRERALAIYRRARPGYHPIAVDTVDRIVGWSA